MNINLANIDFIPGQGGSGEAVIRSLDVTENGTYSAPSGVDGYSPVNVNVSGGGSLTPEEQEALDTLVNSSDGVLYTGKFERYHQYDILTNTTIYPNNVARVFWDDLYMTDFNNLYKLNRESYQFEMIAHFNENLYFSLFFKDKSGRLYSNLRELNLENGTLGERMTVPDNSLSGTGSLNNFLYGKYGVWALSNNAYKFNESTQEFEQMPLNSTFGYSGAEVYFNLFKYDGHILGVYNNLTFEVTEYEDHIDVADVTGAYFNMPSFEVVDSYGYKSTKDGNLYYINNTTIYIYDKSLGNWVSIDNASISIPIYGDKSLVSDNILFSFDDEENNNYMNLGPDFSTTFWTQINNIAVDLKSYQKISGDKIFNGRVDINNNLTVKNDLTVNNSLSVNNSLTVASIYGNDFKIISDKITFKNNKNTETVIKNGGKPIVTADQAFMNSTFIPYGTDGDSSGYFSQFPEINNSFTTNTKRLFNKYKNLWYEFTGTNKPVDVSFGIDFSGSDVKNSPSLTILVTGNNTYSWNDGNTNWDLLCSSDNITSDTVWFDGENFRSGNTYKLVDTEGVWSWVSDPLVNNIFESGYKYGYINNDVYIIYGDQFLYKYDKVNCVLNKVGFLGGGGYLWSYFDKLFRSNGGSLYMIDLSKADPQNPNSSDLRGKILHTTKFNTFIGATDRLWYYNEKNEMCSLYENIYEKPEVPATDGTYTLKAVRAGDQITYNWVLDA